MQRNSDGRNAFDFLSNPAITEPFGAPRSAARLLFDFSVLAACMNPRLADQPVIDFGAGSGWITEMLARMGHRVTAFDIHGDLEGCLQRRIDAEMRLQPELISFRHGDGHAMPFADGAFGQLLCYDSLHHMHDYPRVFGEIARVLQAGGRAVFVEPGAQHSKSAETIEFLRRQKTHDPTWIERDVVLEEIDAIAQTAGLTGLTLVPVPHPDSLQRFTLADWLAYRAGDAAQRQAFAEQLSDLNYNERIVFYCDKRA